MQAILLHISAYQKYILGLNSLSYLETNVSQVFKENVVATQEKGKEDLVGFCLLQQDSYLLTALTVTVNRGIHTVVELCIYIVFLLDRVNC